MTPIRPVLIAAGGTGGHIFPALAVANVLRTRDVPVVWVGNAAGMEARIVGATDYAFNSIPVVGLRGKGLVGVLRGLGAVVAASLQSVRLLRRLRPRAVLGMGGFVTGPVGLASVLTRVPLVLHEQNAVPGMTNRWLSRVADRVCSAFPDVFAAGVQARVVGNPLRDEIESLAGAGPRPRNGAAETLNLLVVGGSRGARHLNTVVPDGVAEWLASRPDVQCRVTHQCGDADGADVRAAWQRHQSDRLDVTVSAFIDDMAAAYRQADLVICRAGAMTVSELAAAGRASILVPFPHAVDDHQTRNAGFLATHGAAVLLAQSEFTDHRLAATLAALLDDAGALQRMGEAARQCHIPESATRVADLLQEVVR